MELIPTDYGPKNHILRSPRQILEEVHDFTEYGDSMMRIRTFIANWIGLEENEEELNEVEPRPDHQIMDKMLVDYYISSAA